MCMVRKELTFFELGLLDPFARRQLRNKTAEIEKGKDRSLFLKAGIAGGGFR